MSTPSLPSTPVPQSELVVPQAGAVVSRTLVKASGGTVTAFAFDTGEALSEHSAPFDALVHMLEGEAEIRISGKPLDSPVSAHIIAIVHCSKYGAVTS